MQRHSAIVILTIKNKSFLADTIVPRLLENKTISRYIISKWKTKIEYYGQYFPEYQAISEISSEVNLKKDKDAIKMYTIFSKAINTEPIMIYGLMWDYIVAFCGFIRTKCGHIFYDPLEFDPEEFTKNISSKNVVKDKISASILGEFLGIPGITMLAKWEENSEKKNQSRLFKERNNRYFEYIRLPMVEIFDEDSRLENIRKSLQNI